MTREEILAMEPGDEMDVLIATKVMGIRFPTVEEMKTEAYEQWKIQAHCRHFLMGFEAWIEDGEFEYRYKTKLYSTMISAAWEVESVIKKSEWHIQHNYLMTLHKLTGEYTAMNLKDIFSMMHASPEDRCKAALLAVLEATP